MGTALASQASSRLASYRDLDSESIQGSGLPQPTRKRCARDRDLEPAGGGGKPRRTTQGTSGINRVRMVAMTQLDAARSGVSDRW